MEKSIRQLTQTINSLGNLKYKNEHSWIDRNLQTCERFFLWIRHYTLKDIRNIKEIFKE